jgi:hypothetical protein
MAKTVVFQSMSTDGVRSQSSTRRTETERPTADSPRAGSALLAPPTWPQRSCERAPKHYSTSMHHNKHLGFENINASHCSMFGPLALSRSRCQNGAQIDVLANTVDEPVASVCFTDTFSRRAIA